MWHDKRGKAILKLCMWFVFFLLMSIAILLTNTFSNSTIPPKVNEPVNNEQKKYLNLKEIWNLLSSSNYHYQYQIHHKITNESTVFQGEKNNDIDTGYRESKIGIIKYRLENGHIYQIFVDNEEEIPKIFESDDENYLNLEKLYLKLEALIPNETISGTMRKLIFQNGEEIIEVTTTINQIKQIRINTSQKEYNLSFTIENNTERKD